MSVDKHAPPKPSRWLGQHFLRSAELAASLVARAGISSFDLVIEIGAGEGIITKELARRASQVLAVELDRSLAADLLAGLPHQKVLLVAGDFFDLPLPADRFRVFGNIPFDQTTRLLRYLLNPIISLTRADLIVQRGAAIKRARRWNLLNLCWAPWWVFEITARIPARSFRPRPSIDAALLSITRRPMPLLPESDASAFAEFARTNWSTRDLTLHQWVALYRARE